MPCKRVVVASATANVVASHWIGDDFWEVDGRYDYALARESNRWVITSMMFTLDGERGSRDVFGPAMKVAAGKWLPGYTSAVATRNKATVRAFFKALENEDIAGLIGLFADDGVQRNPYNAGLFPAGARGREELMAYWSPVPGNFDRMRFPIDEVLATEDPSVVFVRYRGDITLKDGAGSYRNNYYSTFRFNPMGEIEEYVEVFDPVVAARGFGLLDQLR